MLAGAGPRVLIFMGLCVLASARLGTLLGSGLDALVDAPCILIRAELGVIVVAGLGVLFRSSTYLLALLMKIK